MAKIVYFLLLKTLLVISLRCDIICIALNCSFCWYDGWFKRGSWNCRCQNIFKSNCYDHTPNPEGKKLEKFNVTNLFVAAADRWEPRDDEALSAFIMKHVLFFCLFFSPACSLPWLCSWPLEWKAKQAHMLRFVSTWWRLKGRYGRRDEIRTAVVYFQD